MKKFAILTLILLGSLSGNAQEIDTKTAIGAVYTILQPSGKEYKFINFPKKNIIVKRGGLMSNALVIGKNVIVTKIVKNKDESTIITVKPTESTWFYNAIPTVTIQLEEALKTKELKITK